jgi:hypothetical protein
MYTRIIYLFIFTLSLFNAHAQEQKEILFRGKAKTGYYILTNNPRVVYAGKIKVYNKELIIKNSKDKDLKYKPDEVYWARVDTIRYTTASNFITAGLLGSATQATKAFVEIADSGQVSLYRYRQSSGYYSAGSAGGAAGSSADILTFMLHDAADNSITTLRSSKGQRFRNEVAPFVAARADLLQLLDDGRITIDNLPLLLHALNNNEPFPIKFKAKKVKEKVIEDPFGGN